MRLCCTKLKIGPFHSPCRKVLDLLRRLWQRDGAFWGRWSVGGVETWNVRVEALASCTNHGKISVVRREVKLGMLSSKSRIPMKEFLDTRMNNIFFLWVFWFKSIEKTEKTEKTSRENQATRCLHDRPKVWSWDTASPSGILDSCWSGGNRWWLIDWLVMGR